MAEYIANRRLYGGGKFTERGKPFSAAPHEAEPLLKSGAITANPKHQKKKAEPKSSRIDPAFLDRSVAAILPDLEGKSRAELEAIHDAEKHGKTRKSLMAPIEALLAE